MLRTIRTIYELVNFNLTKRNNSAEKMQKREMKAKKRLELLELLDLKNQIGVFTLTLTEAEIKEMHEFLDLRNQIEALAPKGYDLALMSANPLNPNRIEFKCDESGFKYRVIGLDKKEKSGFISRIELDKLIDHFPKTDQEVLANKDKLLPLILGITSKARHTQTIIELMKEDIKNLNEPLKRRPARASLEDNINNFKKLKEALPEAKKRVQELAEKTSIEKLKRPIEELKRRIEELEPQVVKAEECEEAMRLALEQIAKDKALKLQRIQEKGYVPLYFDEALGANIFSLKVAFRDKQENGEQVWRLKDLKQLEDKDKNWPVFSAK